MDATVSGLAGPCQLKSSPLCTATTTHGNKSRDEPPSRADVGAFARAPPQETPAQVSDAIRMSYKVVKKADEPFSR
jgi:hypothetical protein